MTIGNKSIYAIIRSPANAEFEYVPASTNDINYLDETKPVFSTIMSGKDLLNGKYGKLQFKLTGVSGKVITRVDFVDDITTKVTEIIQFKNWNTTN